jgi:hypothetical protein
MVFEIFLWRVLRKLFLLEEFNKVCAPLSVKVFVTLAIEQHLEYHCKAFFQAPRILSIMFQYFSEEVPLRELKFYTKFNCNPKSQLLY